LDTV